MTAAAPQAQGNRTRQLRLERLRDLVVRAHIQPGAPIVLIWDNLNTHRVAGMREYTAAQHRLH